MAETIELGERNNKVDLKEAAIEETNLNDDDDDTERTALLKYNPNESIQIMNEGANPDAVSSRPGPDIEGIPNARRDGGVIKRLYIQDQKDFLKKLGININKEDGPLVFDGLKFEKSKKGVTNGATFNGEKIIVMKGKEFVYSEAGQNKKIVNALKKFKKLVKEAEEKHREKAVAPVEEQLNKENIDAQPELTKSVVENSIENIDDRISEISDNVELTVGEKDMVISDNALRELRAPLFAKEANKGTMEYLDINAKHWVDMAKEIAHEPGREKETKLYETVAAASMLRADQIRLRLGLRPQYEETLKIMREQTDVNILTRFERFKKWAKENLGAISAVTISVAVIITTIAVGFKSALKTGGGAKATSNFTKALANLAGKLAPILGSVLSIISTVLSFGAKGLAFLSNNLWILAIALGYFLYNEIRKKYKKR